MRLEFDAEHTVLVGRRGAGDRAMERRQRYGQPAAGESDALGHLSHDPDPRVGVLLPRDQEHPFVVPTSTDSVNGMPGKTTVSSSGIIRQPVHECNQH